MSRDVPRPGRNHGDDARPAIHLSVCLLCTCTCTLPGLHLGSSSQIVNILNECIQLAGLDISVYSAKSFRPTCATRAIQAGCDPKKTMRVGRWKTETVFFEHYVHDKTPDNFTNLLMK